MVIYLFPSFYIYNGQDNKFSHVNSPAYVRTVLTLATSLANAGSSSPSTFPDPPSTQTNDGFLQVTTHKEINKQKIGKSMKKKYLVKKSKKLTEDLLIWHLYLEEEHQFDPNGKRG